MRQHYTAVTPIVTFTDIYYTVSDGITSSAFMPDSVTDGEHIGRYRNRLYSFCVAVYL